jgi:hypothetical protein
VSNEAKTTKMNIEGKEERCWGGNTPQQLAQSKLAERLES